MAFRYYMIHRLAKFKLSRYCARSRSIPTDQRLTSLGAAAAQMTRRWELEGRRGGKNGIISCFYPFYPFFSSRGDKVTWLFRSRSVLQHRSKAEDLFLYTPGLGDWKETVFFRHSFISLSAETCRFYGPSPGRRAPPTPPLPGWRSKTSLWVPVRAGRLLHLGFGELERLFDRPLL